ncbi:O-methyltransferase [Iningainema tapete]|uniref:Class I SAM-dependent methyltransferase n=1 Tax=Iningainema tapete BLCC-T55 TaxID=2748662 RepID=A0A8J7C0J9_9CYAN|nr:class I SAM-dependent methyltransferase [Iningainema tapete]MBD2778158.1 class I SAM-dependent methyltransferase [Iningainema tapete BLCC-T55]
MTELVKIPKARPVTPLGILTEQLESIILLVKKQVIPKTKLVDELNSVWELAAGLDSYIGEYTTKESNELAELAHKTAKEAWERRYTEGTTVRPLEQEMLSGHVEGQVLKMFIHMTKATKVLEIGMFTGYSALAMAEALPPHGQIVACEVDPYTAEFAQQAFDKSPHGQKIRVEVGKALEILDKLVEENEKFDFVFIDADKKEYVAYFNTLLDKNLLSTDAYICVDNTLLQGEVYLNKQRTANGEAIAQFNQIVAADPRVEQVLLPLRDGLTIIRRLPAQ